jgi:hypothetical protein
MGSRISGTRLPASERSEALHNAGARIRQHLNNAVVAQRIVQQLEEDIRATEAPGLAKFAESRQRANVAFPGQFRQDDEPAVGLLEGDALANAPAGHQLLECRDRDRVLSHPLHGASAVDCEGSAPVYPQPTPVRAAIGSVPRVLVRQCGSARCPEAVISASAQPWPCVPVLPAPCVAHVSVPFKLELFDREPLFVRAAYALSVGQTGGAYSTGRPRTRRASAAARKLRAPKRIFFAANMLGSEEGIHP